MSRVLDAGACAFFNYIIDSSSKESRFLQYHNSSTTRFVIVINLGFDKILTVLYSLLEAIVAQSLAVVRKVVHNKHD